MSEAAAGEPLSSEDRKLVTLARATRARIGAAQGAAVRDSDGRTYAAATVALPSLELSAVQAVVAMAVASGSVALDACVVLGATDASPDTSTGDASVLSSADDAVLSDLAGAEGVLVHTGDVRGTIAVSRTLGPGSTGRPVSGA